MQNSEGMTADYSLVNGMFGFACISIVHYADETQVLTRMERVSAVARLVIIVSLGW